MMPFLRWVEALPGRFYCAILGLTDGQQRALMTWGMLGGIVALEVFAWFFLDRVGAIYRPDAPEAIVLAVIDTYREAIRFAFILIGLFAAGIVLIARGGAMSIKLPGGTEIVASAEAAKALAQDTSVKDLAS